MQATACCLLLADRLTAAGDKYVVFMVPDPEADAEEAVARGNAPAKERVAFMMATKRDAMPIDAPGWQVVVAAVLFLLGLGTATQIGLAANVTRFLPQVPFKQFFGVYSDMLLWKARHSMPEPMLCYYCRVSAAACLVLLA